jgi:hypothetical protein
MQQQQRTIAPVVRKRYRGAFLFNEIVLDAASWTRNLPRPIEGFFSMASAPEAAASVRAAHRAFVAQYYAPQNGRLPGGPTSAHPPVLLILNLSHPDAPFRLASGGRRASGDGSLP